MTINVLPDHVMRTVFFSLGRDRCVCRHVVLDLPASLEKSRRHNDRRLLQQ